MLKIIIDISIFAQGLNIIFNVLFAWELGFVAVEEVAGGPGSNIIPYKLLFLNFHIRTQIKRFMRPMKIDFVRIDLTF